MVEVPVDELADFSDFLAGIGKAAGESMGEVTDGVAETATTAEKVGSVTSTVLQFATEHPYLTVAGTVALGVGTIAAVGATKGAITDIGTAFTKLTTPVSPIVFVVDTTGKVVTSTQTPTDTTTKTEDTGLLGWFTGAFWTGLFGTQAAGEDFMTKAKPWLIGGAIVVGAVATAYVVKSVRKPQVVVPIR